jgi:hypothetical protein
MALRVRASYVPQIGVRFRVFAYYPTLAAEYKGRAECCTQISGKQATPVWV